MNIDDCKIPNKMKCILLHGLGQSSSDWNNTIKYMNNSLDVSCPDLFQWLPKTEVCYANLYQELEKYCENFDEPFVLGGLSLGGILALQYVIEHSNKVYSLILMGTQFSMPKNILRIQNIIFRILPNTAFNKMGLGKKEVISLCNSMMDLDFCQNLKDIYCRTLVLCGEKDKNNLSASIKLKEQIENAELVIISNAGHEVNTDNPVELGKTISSFCCGK